MGMFNTETQMFLLDGVNVGAGFAVNWLLQSTLLISIGLIVGALLRSRGSAVQSLVYRTTLIAVLACPLATVALGAAGFSGWSLTMPETLATEAPDRSIEADLKSEITHPFASQESPRESLAQLESLAPNETPIAVVELPQSFTSADSSESPIELVQPPIEAAENPEVEAEVPVTTSIFTIRTLGLLAGLAELIWCLVALMLAFRLASAWLKLWRLKRSATKVEPELQLVCEQLAVRMEVAAPEVYRSPFLPSPCLAGLRNPSILLPEQDCGLSMQDVLIHELAHLRRHDCHWNLLRQIATVVFFFQPLLWILSRKLEVAAEEVCDDFVVQFGGDRTEYANRLVGIAHLSTAPIAAAGVGVVSLRSMLTRRVTRILDTSRTLSTRVGNSILVAVFVCGVFGTGVTGLLGLRAAPPVDGATIVESQNDSNDETNVQQETSSLERNASVEQPPTDGANSLQVTVALPDGSPADETHVALIGYSHDYTKSIILGGATTAKDGTCRLVYKGISEVAEQKATLLARRDGLAIGWKRLNLLNLAVNAPMSFSLKRQEIIKGRLVDIHEKPASGETVQVRRIVNPDAPMTSGAGFPAARWESTGTARESWVPPATTDEDGKFELTGIPKNFGVSFLVVGSGKVAPQRISLNTGLPRQKGMSTLFENVAFGEEAVFTLPPARVITGTITYEDTNEPVANAKVSISGGHTWVTVEGRTDAEGKYRLLHNANVDLRIWAYPPVGVAYMGRKAEKLELKNNDAPWNVDFQLPRATLVKGRVIEKGTGLPVSDATITLATVKNVPKNAITGWRAPQKTDSDGRFSFAVPSGRGTLLVRKKDSNYVLQTMESNRMYSRRTGGFRQYANAFHRMWVRKGADSIDAKIEVVPGKTVRGVIVDEEGKSIKEAIILTHLKSWSPYGASWTGDSRATVGGKFELTGLEPDESYKVYFLDPLRKLGTTVELKATDEEVRVVLQPCGSATAKFLVEDEGDRREILDIFKHQPPLSFRLGPGEARCNFGISGKLMADERPIGNVDPINYGYPPYSFAGPQLDDDFRITYPALIPGATYCLQTSFARSRLDGSFEHSLFTVEPGETLDLGEFTPEF